MIPGATGAQLETERLRLRWFTLDGRFACVWKQTRQIVGICGPKFLPDSSEVDLGYRFLPNFWGMGLATESSRAVIDYARVQLRLLNLVGLGSPR